MATEYKTPQQARDVIFDRMGDITIKGIRPDKNIGIQSYCATYVYRMAWYIVKGVFANVGSGAQAPRTGFVEPNNDSGCVYAKALENLGFNVINRGSKTRADLIKYCDNNIQSNHIPVKLSIIKGSFLIIIHDSMHDVGTTGCI